MPFKSYIEAWCDVCGHQVLGGACQTLDGTPENDGLTFCCLTCQDIHRKEIAFAKEWYGKGYAHTPHREPYREYCFSCENFKNLEPNGPRRGCCFNHVCIVSGDVLGVRTWTGDEEERFEDCGRTFANCFKHRKQIFVEELETDRFELMDFD